jgi:purine-binding chemotaxis protein CheW
MSAEPEAIVARPKPTETAEAIREFLSFLIGPECYALPLSCVREIVRVPAVTEIPRGPDSVLGIVSVRGTVTTVIDLRLKLRIDPPPLGPKTRILIVEGGGEVMGLLVDAVLQVHRLPEQDVELASVLGGSAPPYLVGIGRPGSGAERASGRVSRTAESTAMMLLLDPIALLKA